METESSFPMAGAVRSRTLRWLAAASAMFMALSVLAAAPASADSAPTVPGTPTTVTADSLPTVQINGVVWDQVVVGNTVYATGSFTQARPAGAAAGTNETARSNILAYNLTTGNLITTWAPSLNAQGRAITASVDGSTIYVAGDFTSVSGTTRNRVAALNASTGAVISGFNANVNAHVNDLEVSGSTLYLVGAFTVVGNQARSRLASVSASSGAVTAWAPSADAEVRTLTVPAGAGKVIVGGHFETLNGSTQRGMGALDAGSGSTMSWPVNTILVNRGTEAAIWSLKSNGSVVFGNGMSFASTGNFESTFSSDLNGNLIWVNGCRGDNYDNVAVGTVLYTVGHTHNCASAGGLPQTNPDWTFQRGLAMTTYADPSGAVNTAQWFTGRPVSQLLHWLPTVAAGTFTGQGQGAWTIEGNGQYVVMGGEFPRVNGVAQQGLTRFAVTGLAPNKEGPQDYDHLTPKLVGIAPGSVRISWTTTWDRDNERLTYEVLRGTTVIATMEADSNWWTRPEMAFIDRGATPGSTQSYRVRVRDVFNNILPSASASITVPSGAPSVGAYQAAVAADGANRYWRLGEGSGSTGWDSATGNDLTLSGVTRNVGGAISGDADTASTFNGSATVPGTTTGWISAPQTFTVEAWFKTTTNRGGKIIGFGSSSSGNSATNDRSVYMDNSGRIRFGATRTTVLTSGTGYNNGQWHHVVASMGPSGIRLVLDGNQVGANSSIKTAGYYWGYWRVGGDQLSSWPSRPTSNSFAGTLDEVAVYPTELTVAQAANHNALGRGAAGNVAPTASFTASASGLMASVNGSASSDADGSVVSYAWNWGDGSAAGSGVSATHTYAAAGTYTITLTVTDDDGATGSTTRSVTVTAPPSNVAPVASFSASVSGLVASVNGSASSDADGSVVSYGWNWGDGSAAGSGVSATHTYAAAGTYTITLTVTDDDGATGSTTRSVTVGTPPGNSPFVQDAFGRTATGGWGSADLGGAWTVSGTASNYSVSGGEGRISLTAGGGRTASLSSVSQSSADVTARLSLDKAMTGGGVYMAVIGRQVNSSNDYRLKLRVQSNGSVTAQLVRVVAGSEAVIQTVATVPGVTVAAGDGLQVRFQVSGAGTTALAAKVWKSGTAEPAAWLLESSDSTAVLQASGAVGLWAYLSGSATNAPVVLSVDDLDARPVGGTPPPANVAPVASFSASVSGLVASVNGSASSDADGSVVSYGWNWGDGSAAGSGVSATHTYAAAGTYTITLTVTDDDGATGSTTRSVTVGTPPGNSPFVQDAFGRTATGGWGSADLGGAWTVSGTASNYSVSGGEGRISLTAGGVGRRRCRRCRSRVQM
ncbi:MAG: PKD domain-containing protein [Microthrixaceae bacterium]